MAKERAIAEIKDGAVYVIQPGTPVFVKTADVAAMFGKSNQWIGQLRSQGTISNKRTADGVFYEIATNVRRYTDMLESRTSEEDEDIAKLEKAKLVGEVKYKKAKADIATLESKELSGEMHRSEDVEALTADLLFAVRGALMSLPGRLSVPCSQVSTPIEEQNLIRQEINQILDDLSRYEYDPAAYEERVRERMKRSAAQDDDEDG